MARSGLLGGLRGATAHDVLGSGLEILDQLRYAYVEEAFSCLVALWDGARAEQDREPIERSVQRLSAYTIPIWETVGAGVQLALTEELDKLDTERRAAIRPLVLMVCRTLLSTEMNHSEQTSYNTVSFRKAEVVAHETLVATRTNAVRLGLEALEASVSSKEWQSAWSCLWSGATGAGRQRIDADVEHSQLELLKKLCAAVIRNMERIPFDVLQAIEEDLFWTHRRLKGDTSPQGESL